MIHYLDPETLPPPVGEYRNVAIVDPSARIAHVAGQLPLDGQGQLAAGMGFAEQAAMVFGNLARALRSAGSSLAYVAHIRAFLVDEADLPGFRVARSEAFSRYGVTDPPPATTVVVKALVGGSLIELDAVAAIPFERGPGK